jgi:peptidoglycan/LPS O-acetylase OafA/YrhL
MSKWTQRLDLRVLDRPGVTSLLDHIRWLSALAVLTGHARNATFLPHASVPDLGWLGSLFYALTNIQNEAVVCFFVISGALIGGKVLSYAGRPHFPLARYSVDRLSRIYVVLLPALLLSALASLSGGCALGDTSEWLGAASFVQHIVTTLPDCNRPLWSMANEFWYYVLIALIALAFRRRLSAVALILAVTLLLLALDPLTPQNVLAYFPMWVLGMLLFVRMPAIPPLLLFAGFVAALILSRSHVIDDWFWLRDLLIALGAAGFLSTFAAAPSSQTALAFPRTARLLAGFSFSLYLTHWPVLYVMVAALRQQAVLPLDPRQPLSYAWYALIVGICMGVAYAFSLATEARTGGVRRWFYRWLPAREATAAAPTRRFIA